MLSGTVCALWHCLRHPTLLRDVHTGDSVVIHSIGSTTTEVHTHGTLIGLEVPAILLVTSPFTVISYSSLARSHQVTYHSSMDRFTVLEPQGVPYHFVRHDNLFPPRLEG